jgi:hypothetical protein
VEVSRDVDEAHRRLPPVRELKGLIRSVGAVEQAHLGAHLGTPPSAARQEKVGEVAAELQAVHDLGRARWVGSVHAIIPAAKLRPRTIADVERGMEHVAGSRPEERDRR